MQNTSANRYDGRANGVFGRSVGENINEPPLRLLRAINISQSFVISVAAYIGYRTFLRWLRISLSLPLLLIYLL